jgi:general secretion pathway protein M
VIAAARAWWLGLARRERAMVAGTAALAIGAFLYLVAIEPAWKARARLGEELPRLRAQAAEVDALAREAGQLKRRGVAAESGAAAKDALERSLAAADLRAARVSALDERRVVVSAKAVPAARWLAWLEEAARESRLRVALLRISQTAARGVVDAEVTFEAAARQ